MTPWLLKDKETAFCSTPWWKVGNVEIAGLNNCHGFMMLARYVASGSLEEIADRSTGISKWGVLRADVDRLGQVFTERLGDDRTLSRVSMLSYQLSYFFNNWIDQIAARPRYKGQVYVIYSGGDDLSVLGSWSALMDLVLDIRQEFARFTTGKLTISAGIYLAPSAKFPVYQAAKEAGDLVDMAKDHGRDRIAIFGRTITWEEYAKLKDISADVESLFDSSVNLPRSLFSTLYSSWEDQEGDNVHMNRIWRLFYAFGKMKERVHRNDTALKLLTTLEQKIMINQNSALRANLDVAVRWAEYLTRGKGEIR
jgi:CRISPR-associated protein Csm1